jgi:hypothetical protein
MNKKKKDKFMNVLYFSAWLLVRRYKRPEGGTVPYLQPPLSPGRCPVSLVYPLWNKKD